MSLLSHRLAMMGVALALAATAGPVEVERAVRKGAVEPERKSTPGNPSGHTPHQGKREMERRRKRMEKLNHDQTCPGPNPSTDYMEAP